MIENLGHNSGLHWVEGKFPANWKFVRNFDISLDNIFQIDFTIHHQVTRDTKRARI